MVKRNKALSIFGLVMMGLILGGAIGDTQSSRVAISVFLENLGIGQVGSTWDGTGTDPRPTVEQGFIAVDKNFASPFRLSASPEVDDSKIFIEASTVEQGDGGSVLLPPQVNFQSYPATSIDFDTGVVTGGTVLLDGVAFALPTCLLGDFARFAFAYDELSNAVNVAASIDAVQVNLEEPQTLAASIQGIGLGYVDLECNGGGNAFKTIGAAESVVKNSSIFRYGTAGSGSGGGFTTQKIDNTFTGDLANNTRYTTDLTNGPLSVTLPAGFVNAKFRFKDDSENGAFTVNPLTIGTTGGDTIVGDTQLIAVNNFEEIEVYWDGTEYKYTTIVPPSSVSGGSGGGGGLEQVQIDHTFAGPIESGKHYKLDLSAATGGMSLPLPACATGNEQFRISDVTGDKVGVLQGVQEFNLTLNPAGANTIQGDTSYTQDVNGQWLLASCDTRNGGNWTIDDPVTANAAQFQNYARTDESNDWDDVQNFDDNVVVRNGAGSLTLSVGASDANLQSTGRALGIGTGDASNFGLQTNGQNRIFIRPTGEVEVEHLEPRIIVIPTTGRATYNSLSNGQPINVANSSYIEVSAPTAGRTYSIEGGIDGQLVHIYNSGANGWGFSSGPQSVAGSAFTLTPNRGMTLIYTNSLWKVISRP